MTIRSRLAKLEQQKPKVVYPSFSQMYELHTKDDYNEWLLRHNPRLTIEDINKLGIRTFDQLYSELNHPKNCIKAE
jgi:hypothetical protein